MNRSLNSIRRSLSIMATISVLVTLYFAKDLVLPILLGMLLALTLSPLTRFFRRLGVPYVLSGPILILMTAASIAFIIAFSAGTVNSLVDDAPAMGRELREKLSGITKTIDDVRDASKEVEDLAAADAPPEVQEVVIRQPSLLDSAVSNVSSFATTMTLALVLATFLLVSGDLFYIKLVQSFRLMSDKKRALSAVYDIERKVSRYLLTITLINAALGCSIALVLTLLGLEYAYIWGIVAFLLNFVPYAGGLLGTALVGAYAIVFFDSVTYALAAPAAYLALTSIEGQFVTPTLVGKRLEMNSVAVFLAVVLWGWLWGIPGALVAVPFLVVFKVICERFEGLETFANFLGSAEEAETSSSDDKGI